MDRPESVIHLTALEPLRLKLVIGLHPLDRFTKLVKIADGLAVAVGIEEPLDSLCHHGQVLKRKSAPVQSFQVVASAAAILGRRRSPPGGAQRKRTTGIKR